MLVIARHDFAVQSRISAKEAQPCRKDHRSSSSGRKAARFEGQEIVSAGGNTAALEPACLQGQPILSLRTFGKQFIIELPDMALRIHFMLFGSYRIDERKDRPPRLALGMEDGGELNFYGCSVKEVDPDLDAVYDWSADVMSDRWSAV